jgi:hypothetical protein
MRTITCICKNCGRSFEKPLNEYHRKVKLSQDFFCSRTCSGINNLKNFGLRVNRIPPAPRYGANPFRYYLRNCQKRFQECNLTLEYLQQVWEQQDGFCPYSKVKLILNTHCLRHPDKRFTASLDRIDSTKGYITGNVQFTSMAINYLKNTMSHQETIEFLQLLAKNLAPLS